MMVHEKLISFFSGFYNDAHPMSIMAGVVGALSSFVHGDFDYRDKKNRDIVSIKLIAKMPTLAALAFRTAMGLPIVFPKKKYGYIENFLYMMFSNPMEEDF